MSGVYFITIMLGNQDGTTPIIFKGSFVVDYNYQPNIVAFFEDGNPNNILAPINSYNFGDSDNIFISRSYPFSFYGTCITSMSYYGGNYGDSTDNTFFLYSYWDEAYNQIPQQSIGNFPDDYLFSITGGPVYPPFPLDGSIPPPCFYTIQGLPTYLNQNVQYKIYYSDIPQFPYLTVNTNSLFPNESLTYAIENVPLDPFLSNMDQSQLLTYQQQLQLFRKVYEHNSNAYLTYVSNPGTAKGPIYYTFQNYKEMNNYKAGLQLVNRLYPFDQMANAYDFTSGNPLRWIVPFPM